VTEKKTEPTEGSHGTDQPRETPGHARQEFEQLALGATLTGQGSRTEDHYERGAKLKIKGERGVFTYRHASVSRAGSVSLHLQGTDGARAVRPDQVIPVRKRRCQR
jgi:hypothetical protein